MWSPPLRSRERSTLTKPRLEDILLSIKRNNTRPAFARSEKAQGGDRDDAKSSATVPGRKRKIYQHRYFRVLCAIAIGVLLGYFDPLLGAQLKPLGDMLIHRNRCFCG
jgi:hypothetical protein